MMILKDVPHWDEIERNLTDKFDDLNQAFHQSWAQAEPEWHGFTRRISSGFDRTYGYLGGGRIDSVREALNQSYPMVLERLRRRWVDLDIDQIVDVLVQISREVALILGGSVAIGSIVGGVAGGFFLGAGAGPGLVVGGGVGLQVGSLILSGLGLYSIAEYFYKGLPECLLTLQDGITTAWSADLETSVGVDPTGGARARREYAIDSASRLLARGQEQFVTLLLTAIVTYLTRGQIKSGLTSGVESLAARSAKLRSEISNRRLADWLTKNEQKILAHPDFQPVDSPKFTFKQAEADAEPSKPKPKANPLERLEELKIKDFNPYENPRFKEMSSVEKQKFLKNYSAQLKAQQDAINNMTAEEFKSARDSYKSFGRNPAADAMQRRMGKQLEREIAEKIQKTLVKKGVDIREAIIQAKARAKEVRSTVAALHEPDMVAGGWLNPNPVRMGDSSVNSSIGGSWSSRLNALDDAVESAMLNGNGSAKLNVRLNVLRGATAP
ncbi:polymorphic toxin type 15 domain-containing protein [Pseudomonas syringae]|uniref:polymorphic toxin type 15 domain-containing protein n=1 Tax=Pseudomonas syringae TaxID=317 RepID=UPI0002ADC266|nr:polymorphic toxin type 15 domain-containing protein [Pseudomonas syringae]ELS43227.1 Hypothetical protein PSSB64_3565 [Pseudomonas syringae pv. syringae B64]RML38340.1 hypothetical protein ALQ96_04831 [Pseudomonas syringae pv. atrofaciens]